MGGRGASSSTFLQQFGSNDVPWSKGLGFTRNKTLKEAIGPKGEPLSQLEAVEGANPKYSPDYKEYSFNCQRAVVAFELRRRGYDVTAQATYKGDELPQVAFADKNGSLFSYWQGTFQNGKRKKIGKTTRTATINAIENKMSSFGENARAIIGVRWNGFNTGGHVFNVERKNGDTKYFDAQTGKRVNIKEYMNNARPLETTIMRTDNLRISERAKDLVTRKE